MIQFSFFSVDFNVIFLCSHLCFISANNSCAIRTPMSHILVILKVKHHGCIEESSLGDCYEDCVDFNHEECCAFDLCFSSY